MKFLLITLFTLPLFASGQDSLANCKLTRETDPFTKETKISTEFLALDGAMVSIDASSAEIDFLFSIEGADHCFDNNSMAAIFFEGTKTKLNSRNAGSMNCEGLFHINFKNTVVPNNLLTKMMATGINHILFTGNNKKDFTLNLNPADQHALLMLITCIVNDAKTLIKQ